MTDREAEIRQHLLLGQVEEGRAEIQRLRALVDKHEFSWMIAKIEEGHAEIERLREYEVAWKRVCEELRNAKLAIANITQRLELKLDELRKQDAEIQRLRDAYARGWEDGGNSTLADIHEDNPVALQRCREALDRAESAEIQRLRGLLRRLEWDRNGYCTACDAASPAQTNDDLGHQAGCWLAVEIGRS